MQEKKVQKTKNKSNPIKWKNGGLFSGSSDFLKMISGKMCLSEGEEAVKGILRGGYRRGKIRTRELTFVTRLPIPVVTAGRRELEKARLYQES